VYRLGIDVGGTFTDFMLLRETDDRSWTHKQLTTPHDPVLGIMQGLDALLRDAGLRLADVADAHVVHGTTLVTNALIERKGCRVGLIATRGTRDVLETGKENRYDPYDRHILRAAPLVERRLRREIRERIGPDGRVVLPLQADELDAILDDFERERVESVAVCLLHAYRNPAHEAAIGAAAAARGFSVSLSSVVSPEINEYERVSTTVANAYIQPFAARYVAKLAAALAAAGFRRGLYLMLSDGGVTVPDVAVQVPIRLLESGPAAGALAAAFYGELLGLRDLIAFDMGGTTAKTCLVHDGAPSRTASFEVGRADRTKRGSGMPVRIPTVEMMEIGAGGGSLAHIDDLGLLKVGPQSAGADPGPACYGLGGERPTVTDANLLLGHMADGAELGEGLRLDRARAERAVEPLARETGRSAAAAAAGIYQIVTESMAHAVKLHITELGRDPRAYALLAFGGAGPLHACAIAQQLGIARVVVPAAAGVLSAFGFVSASPALELSHTFIARLDALDQGRLREVMAELTARAADVLKRSGIVPDDMTFAFTLDMRYAGQGYEVAVALPAVSQAAVDPEALQPLFTAAYERVYGEHDLRVPIEVRTIRLWASGPRPRVRIPEVRPSGAAAPIARRVVLVPGVGPVECPVYDRSTLGAGAELIGPSLVQDRHSTAVLPPGCTARVDAFGNLVIDVARASAWRPSAKGDLDPVDLEIILARLRTMMDEADRTILRTAFSAVVREGKDYAVGMSDPRGDPLALPTETMPLFVTCMPRSIRAMLAQIPADTIAPGDILVTNDPWIVAGHKHDLFLLQGVFHEGALVAFVGAISHLPDIGNVVGDFRAWDLYEEGLSIPPTRLYTRGQLNETLAALVQANVRLPTEVMGDIAALRAALTVADRRVREFMVDTRLGDFTRVSAEIRVRALRAFEKAVARIPPGTYRYTHVADGTGGVESADEPIRIAVALTAGSSLLRVDYEGTSPQLPHWPINVPIPYTLSDTVYALQYLFSPTLSNLGPSYDLVTVAAPPRSILNSAPPAPIYARTRTGVHITTALCGALVQADPALAMAGCGHNVIMKVSGTRPDGSYFGVGLMPKGGMGATLDQDGWNVTVFPTNCTMIPTETFETLCPLEMSREITTDSGGAGRRRGGVGQRVTFRCRSESPVLVSVRFNFVRHPAPGLVGGLAGGPVRAWLNGAAIPENPVTMREGDLLVVETAGGGGFGDPKQREPERVLEDVRQGYVSVDAAREIYGVAIPVSEVVPARDPALRRGAR